MSRIQITNFLFGIQSDINKLFSHKTHYSFNRFYYVKKGMATYTDDDGEIQLKEGNLYLLPLKKYALEEKKTGEFEHIWGHFIARGFQFHNVVSIELTSDLVLQKYVELIDTIVCSHSIALSDNEQCSIISAENRYFSVADGLIASCICYFYQNYYNQNPYEDGFYQVIDYISGHLGDALSNDVLAKVAMHNKNYFIQKFTSIYNLPPQKYVLKVRISEAIIMLMNDCKVDNISYHLGYDNPKSFTRAFKREVGIPPFAYKAIHYYKDA
jgi:AraC-like DNA-binding protein